MSRDDVGETGGDFPKTRQSLIVMVREGDDATRARAVDAIAAAYWKPVFKYLRLRWDEPYEDACDLTQSFLARAVDGDFFARYDPSKARFRTYVRVCVDRFVSNERKAASRIKRGGQVQHVPLEFEDAEGELACIDVPDGADPEMLFRREWIRSLFELAIDDLRRHCEDNGKRVHYALFEAYDLGGPTSGKKPSYADLAAAHGIPATQVTNHLASARRKFRELLLDRIRETSGSETEFREDVNDILGVDPR